MKSKNAAALVAKLVETPVGRLVAEGPHRARLLEEHGIDYCCGGRRTLNDACQERGLIANDIARELLWADMARTMAVPTTDWNRASLSELCDHIERTHHEYLRTALPRITYLMEKVAAAHGETDRRLLSLQHLLARFREDLETHTLKEELVAFPWVRRLEVTDQDGGSVASAAVPFEVLMAEHDDAGEALRQMRALTDDFTPPDTACNTYRALIAALSELEADMHQHVHKENNILFPRALELQKSRDAKERSAAL